MTGLTSTNASSNIPKGTKAPLKKAYIQNKDNHIDLSLLMN